MQPDKPNPSSALPFREDRAMRNASTLPDAKHLDGAYA
jgi:hypothetical protein